MLQLLTTPKFSLFRSTVSPFSTGHFETNASNHTKMTLNSKRSKIPPHMLYKYPRVSIFTPFDYTARRFRVTGHLDINASNDPKTALNTKRSKVPHIHITTILLLPLSLKFQSVLLYGQPFSRYRPFWGKCTDSKTTLNTKRSQVPHIHVGINPESQIHFFSLHRQPFSSYMPFWDKCTKLPQNDIQY